MATEVVMPRQGNTVESCVILAWKKREGDRVEAGETLCEVETDKATFEVGAPTDGTLLKVLYQEGDDVPVLKVIAVVGEPGEDVSTLLATAGGENAAQPRDVQGAAFENARDNGRASIEGKPVEGVRETLTKGPAATRTDSDGGAPGDGAAEARGRQAMGPRGAGELAASPRARGLAAARGVQLESLGGSGPGGRIIERDVRAAIEAGPLPTAAAAALMRERGLPAPAAGSGIGGRVRVADLEGAAVGGAGRQPLSGAAARGGSGLRPEAASGTRAALRLAAADSITEIPVRSIRKVTAERMRASLSSTAQLTLDSSADASALLSYRAALKASPQERGLSGVTIGDMVMFAAARTLTAFTALNAHFLGDKILQFDHVHLGFAVDTPRGLFVPVIRFADLLSLKGLSAEAKRLSAACLEGKASAEELSGATFTVTNLGAFGIERFTPVLNPPQAAILGVNAIQPKAVQAGAEVKFLPHIGLSLTIDHQAVDGAPAARFLAALAEAIGGFELLLAE